MTPFSTFALLYMAALWLELSEKWTYPLFTLGILLLVILLLAIGITRLTFLAFLAVTTAHLLLVQFPEVANHVNVAIYCNLFLMLAIGYSLVRMRDFPTDDDCYEMMRPVLQASLMLVYALAGFHKLNADFLDPHVSCVSDLLGDLTRIARSRVAGIPVPLVLVAGALLGLYRLLSASPMRQHLSPAVRVGAIGLVLVAALLVLKLAPWRSLPVIAPAILMMAVVVIMWELVGGLLLAVPRFQATVLAFSWAMHATFALIGFVDFGALALALLFTFVPRPYLDSLSSRLRVPVLDRPVPRAHLYFAINVLSGIFSGLNRLLMAGLLFNAAALVFIWPVLSALVARPRPAWTGVPLSRRVTPKWMFMFPALLALHGLTSYVGLRTAGNFSMYSNLRTEGAVSNHLLLGSNPLKHWTYQEDVVRFIRIDDRQARIGYQYQPLQGAQLPAVEFRKRIYAWSRAGSRIPMTFEYRGRIHSTEDIVNDPVWRTDARDWEMVLMDFRVIQPDGPNRCRW